jgi:hypothetical protein
MCGQNFGFHQTTRRYISYINWKCGKDNLLTNLNEITALSEATELSYCDCYRLHIIQ